MYRFIILLTFASLSIAKADFEPLNVFEATQRLTEGVQLGSLKQVQEAIARGADVNDRNTFGRTPLMTAELKGNAKILKALLEAGANPNLTDDDDNSPLLLASRNCNHRVVRALLESSLSAKADVNHQNHVGQTALHAAAEQGCGLVVLALLKTPGIRINGKDDTYRTAMDYAKETGDVYGDFDAQDLIAATQKSQRVESQKLP